MHEGHSRYLFSKEMSMVGGGPEFLTQRDSRQERRESVRESS